MPSTATGLAGLKRASDVGDGLAQGHYGLILIQGQIQLPKPDFVPGVDCVRKSAQADNDFGLDALARLHIDGLGVPGTCQ